MDPAAYWSWITEKETGAIAIVSLAVGFVTFIKIKNEIKKIRGDNTLNGLNIQKPEHERIVATANQICSAASALNNEAYDIFEPLVTGPKRISKAKLHLHLTAIEKFSHHQTHRTEIVQSIAELYEIEKRSHDSTIIALREHAEKFCDLISRWQCHVPQLTSLLDTKGSEVTLDHIVAGIKAWLDELRWLQKELPRLVGTVSGRSAHPPVRSWIHLGRRLRRRPIGQGAPQRFQIGAACVGDADGEQKICS